MKNLPSTTGFQPVRVTDSDKRQARSLSYVLLLVFCAWFAAASGHAKPPLMTPADTPVLGELDPYLIENVYESPNQQAGLATLQDDPAFGKFVENYDLQLFCGPMLGCVTPDSARFWVRTAHPTSVQVVVTKAGSSTPVVQSAVQETGPEGDFTAVLRVEGLEPWTEYQYDVLLDGESGLGESGLGERGRGEAKPRFRTNPRRDQKVEFSVGFGGGARYVPEKERIWDTIAKARPHAFLFLGDNIYIDEPEWPNRQRAMYYRRQLRPEYRRLVSQASIYAIWDDHDFGKNDVAGGLAVRTPAWKFPAWEIFKENWVNPAYGGGPELPGCWFDFNIGDVDFFMTDGRYYRSFENGTMLGPEQKEWLLERLRASTATFKVIASGTLWTEHADKGGADSWWGVKEEREEIFSLIEREKIPGVVLISADRHRNDIYRIERPNGYDFYEFETSKLTNNHTHPTKPEAIFSYNEGNFYGLLRFDLTADDPTVTFDCISIDGETIYSFPVKRSQLEAGK